MNEPAHSLLPTDPLTTGASCWATVRPSPPCWTGSCTTAMCSSAAHEAGGLTSATREILNTLIRNQQSIVTAYQQPLAQKHRVTIKQSRLRPISMAGFEVTTYGRFSGDHRGSLRKAGHGSKATRFAAVPRSGGCPVRQFRQRPCWLAPASMPPAGSLVPALLEAVLALCSPLQDAGQGFRRCLDS